MERSISTKFWAHISWKRGLYIKALVLTLHNKMEWQKGKNKHLLEVARSSMFTTKIPKYLWGGAILTATYLINRMPSRTFNFRHQ